VGLQIAVGGVEVGAVKGDGAALHVGPGDDVVEAGQREMFVDVPCQFTFQHFIHGGRLPETGVGETLALSRYRRP
jgi:hypothetical protein